VLATVEAAASEPLHLTASVALIGMIHAELFELFASFLIVTQKYKLKACKNYLSQLKNVILVKYKNTKIFDN
jgi:hypothetical protein